LRLRKKKWPLVVAGLLLVATLVSLGIVLAKQAEQRGELKVALARAEESLNGVQVEQVSADHSDLETKLGDALAFGDTARSELSRPTNSIDVHRALFEIAEAQGVTLREITAARESTSTLAELVVAVLPFTVVAEGEVSDLLDFVAALNTDLGNGLVKSAALQVSDTPEEGLSTITIELDIYTYRGE
jgi:hypothetical protein